MNEKPTHESAASAPQMATDDALQLKDLRASNVVRNHMLAAMGLGFVPFPALDALAITGAQVNMIRELAKLYGIELKSNQLVYSLIGSLTAGLGLPLALSPMVLSAFKMVPGLGTMAGVVALPAVAGATTYALGRVFIQHFESGGTMLTLNAKKMRAQMRGFYEQGLAAARTMAAAQSPTSGKEPSKEGGKNTSTTVGPAVATVSSTPNTPTQTSAPASGHPAASPSTGAPTPSARN